MKKWLITLSLIFWCYWSLGQNQRPNVICILADDIGSGDVSAYRSLHAEKVLLPTPNLDILAKEGMLFTNGHAPAALCAPSRYAIMTGQHCYRSPYPW
ncbi:MAG: sulfatase-like hydrolase/transferase, partial [Bacteroidota bacterium]